ncbi:class II fructose-bisphosphate aldolase [Candidatus Campbellbacteria bacterium]|nr:MAG: class II fructose-bisphosphate aldolase [Candidatus Campbellbacteria bacterium]
MKTLREAVQEAQQQKRAIGHFNVASVEMIQAVVGAGKDTELPVIVGVSEGERDVFGTTALVALLHTIREKTGREIYLNADHTYSVERVKEAIDAGFDSVIFDGAELSFEENIVKTKECVAYARASGRDVLVEGELGFIGIGSKMLDALPEGVAVTDETMTTVADALRFVQETGVDMLAPAVGNVHGMLKGGHNPQLNPERVAEIAQAVEIPLVLHGGSGITDEDFTAAISKGISIVHISTELRVAYRQSLQLSLQESPEELAPYKFMKPVISAVRDVAVRRLKLFAGL